MLHGKGWVCFLVCLGLTTISGTARADSAGKGIDAAVGNLDSYISASMAATRVPGLSVAVVYHDQVVFLKGYGIRKIGEPAPVDADTIFELASFSKPIATTVVAEVVGNGKVSWDSRIKDLDPSFALSDAEITRQVAVRDLLSHRSTLPNDAGDTLEALGYDRPEILEKMRMVALKGKFRETYQYTNFGFTEGALAAVRPLNQQWEDVCQQLLYSKLGMMRTSSRYSDYVNRPNRAALHYLDSSGNFHNWLVREADAEAPAGGVNSSARDLAQWLRLQLAGGSYNGRQIVDRNALEETHKPEICQAAVETPQGSTCPTKQFYGMGWDVAYRPTGETMVSHSGAFMSGAATTVYMIPKLDIGILVLTNGAPVGLPEAVALNFLDIFQYGSAKRDYIPLLAPIFAGMRNGLLQSSEDYSKTSPPTGPSQTPAFAPLTGTYTNPYYGNLEIEQQQGKLILRLPPFATYYELSYQEGNKWTYYIANEVSGAARRAVEFSGNSVSVENLKMAYSPVFTKVP
jgi:CubicO group peptidase (beta-lactamase class C family)